MLSEYDITNIKHLAGKDNVIADALSRNVPVNDTLDDLLADIPCLNTIGKGEQTEQVINWNVSNLGVEQDEVELYRKLKQYLKGNRARLPNFLSAP